MVKVNLYGDDDFLISLVLCLVHRPSSTLVPALYVFCIFVTVTIDRVIERRHAKGQKGRRILSKKIAAEHGDGEHLSTISS